jgi:ribose transport system permease protein
VKAAADPAESTESLGSAALRALHSRSNPLTRVLSGQQAVLVIVIIAIGAVAEARNSVFFTSGNVIQVFRATVVYFVAACPATLVLIGGGLDLSIGAVLVAGGVTAGWFMHLGVPWPLAVLLGVALGGAIGGLSAFLIIRVHVTPFVTTLGLFFAVGGIVNVLTGGFPLANFPQGFNTFGQGAIFGLPYLVVYAVIVGVVFHVLLEKMRFGYDTRALGGNRAAALGNGVFVDRVTSTLYVLGGAGAALAGVLLAARLSVADPGVGGSGFTFQVLSAVIIGGTSLFGGIGTIIGTALGTLLFAVINNGLIIIGVDPLWQDVVTGVILITAVALDQARRRRQFDQGRRQ